MRECAELGIEHVWMHRGPGAGSVSKAAAEYGRERGIAVIDGGCPCMFGPTADSGTGRCASSSRSRATSRGRSEHDPSRGQVRQALILGATTDTLSVAAPIPPREAPTRLEG
jgi:hypothetical protein